MAGIYPRQKISEKEKTPQWYKESADYFIDQSSFYSGDRYELILLYQAAAGIVDSSAYKYVLNPYDSKEENLRKYPAQLRNYDIITPLIGLYIGEKGLKPFNHTVICVNSDAPNKYKEAIDKSFMGIMAQELVNRLNQQGVPTGVDTKKVPPLEQVIEEYTNNYNDKRAQFGQEAIDYIKYDLDLKDKYQEALYDWIVTDRCYTYKDIYKNDLVHEIVPPLEMWHGTSNTGYVEDSNWAMRRTRYNVNMVIDKFHEVLLDGTGKNPDGTQENDEITMLESEFNSGNQVVSTTFTPPINNIDKVSSSSTNSNFSAGGLMDVFHIVWKGFKKVGILKYNDELGQEQELEVDETYILNPENGDIEITWEWQNQVHETYRIGQTMYKYCRPLIAQRNELSNTSDCKLPYNGRIGYFERSRTASIVKQLLPYQVLYNIYHFRAELTLARNKDKIMLMPKGLIPAGWDEAKFLYFAEATGLAFFDETKPNAQMVLNAIKGIDMGLGTYVEQMRNLLSSLKAEAWDSVGMNRQRYGDVKASDGKSTTEQATTRSAIISAEMFRRFEKFEDSDLQGLLDYSKLAWINGKKGMYVNSDGRRAFLEVNPDQHLESDYGIFSTGQDDELEKLQRAKEYAFGWAQKGSSPASTVLEVLDSNNMSKLKDYVRKMEKAESDLVDSRQQAQEASAERIQQMKSAEKHEDNETKVTVANIMAKNATDNLHLQAEYDKENLGVEPPPDTSEEVKQKYNDYILSLQEEDRKKSELGLKSAVETSKTRLGEAALQLKDKDINAKLQIAKENKNKYDKK